ASVDTYWGSTFWEYVGLFIFGIVLFALIPRYRREFLNLIKSRSKYIIPLNLNSELLTTLGNLIITFTTLIAPLALVLLVASLQPVFVFIFGAMITFLFPKIAQENLSKIALIQKITAIA